MSSPMGPLQLFTIVAAHLLADGCFCLIITQFEQNCPKLPSDLPPSSQYCIWKPSSVSHALCEIAKVLFDEVLIGVDW